MRRPDEDIRADWRRHLHEQYEIPDVFFVDSLRGLREQQAGQRPSGDLARLQDLLTTQLAASERARSTVTSRIRAAIRQIGDIHPELGRHLQNAVRTGTWCTYRPETNVAWDITRE